ncbi:molybdate transport system substrate-binding protein [Rhodoglobus vestalii]|uniref:Molybdate transport system substrate-binding protein n=1 Tax=Rhodoglobus vestalii TaxID=193384 RepID=A0A8H2K7I1_9MICO|nr:molybdate ABC transporter substrate-binding protein [Rhodoglobus vestalii]TQO20339.1 molybdate transport system substrate-binding protein [Rhodoglobus vestalii]
MNSLTKHRGGSGRNGSRHHRRNRRTSTALAVASLSLAATIGFAGCAPVDSPAASDSSGQQLQGEITIFAAASLSASFTELAEAFTAANPGVTVAPISFDGSSTLATQIVEGAPVDVFASADEATMEKVAEELASTPVLFASNLLQLAVQPGNPLDIAGLADLPRPELQLALCAPEVPCGVASRTILKAHGVAVTPVTEEQNVKAVLTKVKAGEVDAGLVYVTDVQDSAGAVDGVPIPGAERVRNSYPIATMAASQQPDIAEAFVSFVLSDEGQTILATYGFSRP